jgi:hypothetical protein
MRIVCARECEDLASMIPCFSHGMNLNHLKNISLGRPVGIIGFPSTVEPISLGYVPLDLEGIVHNTRVGFTSYPLVCGSLCAVTL